MSGGELAGDPALKITGAASLAEATPGEISFFTNRKYIGLLRKTRASAIFVPPDFAEPIAAAQIRVSNPAKAFEQVVLKLVPKPITLRLGFTQARLSIQVLSLESMCRSSRMRLSKPGPGSVMIQSSGPGRTSVMKWELERHALFIRE